MESVERNPMGLDLGGLIVFGEKWVRPCAILCGLFSSADEGGCQMGKSFDLGYDLGRDILED